MTLIDIGDGYAVAIALNETGNPPGKLADAELHFTAGPFAGLCLTSFAVWESREQAGKINVSVPARRFVSNGVPRSINLIRIARDRGEQEDPHAYFAPLDELRRRVLRAYHAAVQQRPAAHAEASTDEATADDIPF